MLYEPLSRDEVVAVIRGNGRTRRIPMMNHFWIHHETYGDIESDVLKLLNAYPQDIHVVPVLVPQVYNAPPDCPDYRWSNEDDPFPENPIYEVLGLEGKVPIRDWEQLSDIIERFPKASYPKAMPQYIPDGRYALGHWWFGLFEMHWRLRGFVNALTDYYEYPDEVHRLFRAITDLYIGYITRCHEELAVDGVYTSDDIGMQTGPFFSMDIYERFFHPYYCELTCRSRYCGMDHWLHACGAIEPFIPRLIDAGYNVIHPIQKSAVDAKKVAANFGGKVAFNTGMDVQHVVCHSDAEDVRAHVREIVDMFWQPNGRLIFSPDNGINYDTPICNLEALFDEAFTYGVQKANKTGG